MDSVQDILNEELTRAVQEIQANMDSLGINATGKTRNSLQVVTSTFTGSIEANKYFRVVETGRKAGGRPPIENIIEWIEAKGITPTQGTVNSLAWAIATKISQEGTILYKQGGRENVFSNVLENILDQTAERILEAGSSQIEFELFKRIEDANRN